MYATKKTSQPRITTHYYFSTNKRLIKDGPAKKNVDKFDLYNHDNNFCKIHDREQLIFKKCIKQTARLTCFLQLNCL